MAAARLLVLLLATLFGAVSASTQCEPRYSVKLPRDGQTLAHESRHKFLVVLITSEQITAAALHMAEILHLTKLAHRTLILPRVGNSRVDMREPFSWCSYFDVGPLGNLVSIIKYHHAHSLSRSPFGRRICELDDNGRLHRLDSGEEGKLDDVILSV